MGLCQLTSNIYVLGDPNPDINQEMGDPNKKELTEQEMESFDEKRSEAMQTFSEVIPSAYCKMYIFHYLISFVKGEFEKAIGVFTEAIKINSNSAAMFAKRGMCYLKISPKATNACVKVRDTCSRTCSGVTPGSSICRTAAAP